MSTDIKKKSHVKGDISFEFFNLLGLGDLTQTRVPIPGLNSGPKEIIQRLERLARGGKKKSTGKQRRRKRVTHKSRSKGKSNRKRRTVMRRKQRR